MLTSIIKQSSQSFPNAFFFDISLLPNGEFAAAFTGTNVIEVAKFSGQGDLVVPRKAIGQWGERADWNVSPNVVATKDGEILVFYFGLDARDSVPLNSRVSQVKIYELNSSLTVTDSYVYDLPFRQAGSNYNDVPTRDWNNTSRDVVVEEGFLYDVSSSGKVDVYLPYYSFLNGTKLVEVVKFGPFLDEGTPVKTVVSASDFQRLGLDDRGTQLNLTVKALNLNGELVTFKMGGKTPQAPLDTLTVTVTDSIPVRIGLLYEAAFNRKPDEGGLNFWIDQYEAGLTLPQIADRLTGSAEFKSLIGSTAGGDNAGFIDILYKNVLGRAGEAAGRDYWLSYLAGGAARADVVLQFSQSAENILESSYMAGLSNHRDASYWQFDIFDFG